MPERILLEATILPNATRYQVLNGLMVMVLTIVLIPLIPIGLPIVYWYWRRQYAHMRVVLTSRDLKVRRGVLVREEKTIPLEKITDLAVFQGPIMRSMGLKGITVETAGQSSTGALVRIVGLDRVDEFRDAVLRQRDRVAEKEPAEASIEASAPAALSGRDSAVIELLTEIRDTLRRIEGEAAERIPKP